MRLAIFVDAGYLFAGGSTALTGRMVRRADLSLSATSVIEALKTFGRFKAPDSSLLRIYWYDGVRAGNAMSADQAAIADLDDVKLRLGFINGQGEQKGVDSLIVTDLIELARQHSISEAVLLSGDEDVRVGVQIAQNYGVRVHLLGISPARGSQSPTLRQEADTTHEWDRETITQFLSVRDGAAAIAQTAAIARQATATSVADETPLTKCVEEFFGTLQEADFVSLSAFWKSNRGLPKEFDGQLLARAGAKLGRRLERDEMQSARATFQKLVQSKL